MNSIDIHLIKKEKDIQENIVRHSTSGMYSLESLCSPLKYRYMKISICFAVYFFPWLLVAVLKYFSLPLINWILRDSRQFRKFVVIRCHRSPCYLNLGMNNTSCKSLWWTVDVTRATLLNSWSQNFLLRSITIEMVYSYTVLSVVVLHLLEAPRDKCEWSVSALSSSP